MDKKQQNLTFKPNIKYIKLSRFGGNGITKNDKLLKATTIFIEFLENAIQIML